MHLTLITKLRCVLKLLVPITEKGNITSSDCEEGACPTSPTSSPVNAFTTSSECSGKWILVNMFVIVVVIVAMLVTLIADVIIVMMVTW